MEENVKDQLIVKAKQSFSSNSEMYRVIDFLNKNLKEKGVVFGLTKNSNDNTMDITIYEI